MPSIRTPLTTRQKLQALYTDPTVYRLAITVATEAFNCPPGHPDHRRHVTCFLQDLEARLHGNRQKTERDRRDQDLYQLCRVWAHQTTGSDLMLAQPPSQEAVRRWRNRWITPDAWHGAEDQRPAEDTRAQAVAEQRMSDFVLHYEYYAMQRARELGQFPRKKRWWRREKLTPRFVCSADGTYIRAWSKVGHYADPETGEIRVQSARSPKAAVTNGRVKGTRIQKSVHREPKAGRDTMGVNHVALLTRTPYGRVILGIQRAPGGEAHAALRLLDRVAPLAEGAIRALTYDKAFSGWQADYALAHHGIIAVAPPGSAKGALPEVKSAEQQAAEITAAKADALAPPSKSRRRGPKTPAEKEAAKLRSADVKSDVAARLLRKKYDITTLLADLDAKKPLGAGLPLGTSVYLDSQRRLVPVHSINRKYDTLRHTVGNEDCAHELHVDDGALWDTRLELGRRVKDQRLQVVEAEVKHDPLTGWFQRVIVYQFVCEDTGEVLTRKVGTVPSGKWYADDEKPPKRKVEQDIMLLARCDPDWAEIYGLRNDTESWFSWLKQQLLDDKRAPSLDLNHQLLDVLYAGLITNAITRFHARREGGL